MTIPKSLLALTLAVAGLGFGQTVSFLPPSNPLVLGAARGATMCHGCFATADFNRDGKVDVVYMVNSSFDVVSSVAFGNGDGTFRYGVLLDSSFANSDVKPFVGDFNGDGNPDVALSYFGGRSPRVWFGDGNGKFGAPLPIPECQSIDLVADVNGDGKQDLGCDNTVLLSNGDGTFRRTRATEGTPVIAADFNGDGKTDLLLRGGPGQLAVAPGRGDGTFGASIPVVNAPNLNRVLVGDFNGDGHVDLVGALDDELEIVVLPGLGDGTFGPSIPSPWLPGLLDAVADFNGDGKPDLVVGNTVLAGNGDGTFGFPVFIGVVDRPCGLLPNVAINILCYYLPTGVGVADFDGDGRIDIVAAYLVAGIESSTVVSMSVLRNDAPGDGWTVTGVSPATWTFPVSPGSVVAAFGIDLAPRSEAAASTGPLPDTLGGIRVHVRDRSHPGDVLAPLLYVSPSQINYILPSTDPFAWVGIERIGSPFVAKGMAVPTDSSALNVSPTLHSVGDRRAMASAVRISPSGAQTPIAVTSCGETGCTSVPIDLAGDPVYLSLYGSGFAKASPAATSCMIGATEVPVLYIGPQQEVAGLDQINLLLPKSLEGAQSYQVSCSLDLPKGKAFAGPVVLSIG